MKLTAFSTRILNVPEDDPLAGAIETSGATRPMVILTLGTDAGVEGIGVTFYGGALTKTLKSAVDQLCEPPAVEKGEMILSDKPGFGIAFDQTAVRRFAA